MHAAPLQTSSERVDKDRVKLRVEVPEDALRPAVDEVYRRWAREIRVPGFRKGKVPRQVLLARLGRERVYTEAVESHIGGWFWNAAARSGIRPVEQPQYGYQLPESEDESFRFTATVAVQPKAEVAGPRRCDDLGIGLDHGALHHPLRDRAAIVPHGFATLSRAGWFGAAGRLARQDAAKLGESGVKPAIRDETWASGQWPQNSSGAGPSSPLRPPSAVRLPTSLPSTRPWSLYPGIFW